MTSTAELLKKHIHHVRKLREGSRLRYECLDCGKRLKILSGVIVSDPEKYYDQKTSNFAYYLAHCDELNPFPRRVVKWFEEYTRQLEAWGFILDLATTPEDRSSVSFNSLTASAPEVKEHFKALGFVNTDKRVYMAHTGNPHVNLDKDGRTVQVSWYPKGRLVGITFLGGAQ